MLVMLNNSGKKDVYVLGKLEGRRLASFLFHIRDASGKEITRRAFPDDQTFVPQGDPSSFVKLLPSHFLGTDFFAPLELLNIIDQANIPSSLNTILPSHLPMSSCALSGAGRTIQ
jgi:hypothetical protein